MTHVKHKIWVVGGGETRTSTCVREQPIARKRHQNANSAECQNSGHITEDSGGEVTFAGKEPIRKTVMNAGASTACILAANAVSDAAIWRERTGEGQDIHVDLRNAWIEQSPWKKES